MRFFFIKKMVNLAELKFMGQAERATLLEIHDMQIFLRTEM